MRTTTTIAACLLAVAGNALAHPPGFNHDIELFIGGATAETKYLQRVLGDGTNPNALCVTAAGPGTLDIYYNDSTGTKGTNYRAYSCTLRSSAPVPAALQGKTFLLHYRLLSGSIIGVTALTRSTPLDRMDTVNGCTGAHATGPVPQFVCTNTVQAVLDIGLSDQEPQLFIGDTNLPTGDTGLSAAEIASIRITPLHAVLMGIVGNTNLLTALRAKQGLGAAVRPNLTSEQITSLLTANGGPYNKSWAPLTATNDIVVVCRRIEGVGTQLAANVFWGGYPCSSAALLPATAANSTAVYEVHENTLIPDVKSCLQKANDDGKLAIGLLFLDNFPADTANSAWDFVKIDGIEATVANTVEGIYPFYVEETMNVRKTTLVPGALKTATINFLQAQFQNATNLNLANPTTGFAGLPTVAAPTGLPPNNILKSTRFGNTCRAPVLFF